MPLNIPFLYESSFPYFDILRFENYEDDNILNDYEKSIYSSFKIEKRKKEYLYSRICAKRLISSKLNVNIEDITIKNDFDRRPYACLKDGKSFPISLSHTVNMTGCAFNTDFSPYIGIDIEYLKRDIKPEFLSDFIYEDEISIFGNMLKIWSIKEAISKMVGKGLSISFRDIRIKSDLISLKNKVEEVFKLSKIDKIYYNVSEVDDYFISLCWFVR